MSHHPHKHKNYEWWILGLIMLVAIFFRFNQITLTPPGLYPDEAMNGNNALHAIDTGDYKIYYPDNNGREGLFMNIQAQSIKVFGNTPWALRVVSALFGTLTVLGLYLLVRELFNWQIAAFSSFLLAVSFWHTLFSRIGFRAIMAPFFLVWALYFFWKGKKTASLWNFAASGLFLGFGFYSYIAYRVMPLVLAATIVAYWYAIHKDFAHEKYLHIRNQMLRGFAMLMVVAIIVALPLGLYYFINPQDFLGRTAQVSIFSSENPVTSLLVNTGKTLGMFNVVGDWNWRHNFAGRPLLFWPVGVLFVLGFIRSWVKLFRTKRTHGHHPTVQIMLLSWFILGLLPVVMSSEGIPHALRAILLAPVVMIFAGEGLWWLYDFSKKWYGISDKHEVVIHEHHGRESVIVATLAVGIFLFAVMTSEYKMYFSTWAENENVPGAYAADYVALGNLLNQMPQSIKKYVVVNEGGTMVISPDGSQSIAMPAQTVMYITDTWTPAKQQAKNIFYLTEVEHQKGLYDKKNATILFLRPNK